MRWMSSHPTVQVMVVSLHQTDVEALLSGMRRVLTGSGKEETRRAPSSAPVLLASAVRETCPCTTAV